MNSALSYRPDIDGLRAVAVIAVVVYHAFPDVLPGGYVGVDVFFVISGFLITSIIASDLERGRFSLADFYIRRSRRIFPALALVLAATLAAGWLLLLPSEFAALGKHAAGGAAFLTNFVQLDEAGYFDRSAELKPLLHLWSLAIEEQFYIVWPLTALLAFRFKKKIFNISLAVVAVSWVTCIILTYKDPVAAFYTPWSRAWELLLGGCLATAPRLNRDMPGLRHAAALAGFGLIAVAVTLFDHNSAFPGWRAVFPAGGTALMIWAGREAWLNRFVLSRRLPVGIGLISYPLYLWHWPLLSYLAIAGERSIEARLIAVVLAVVLAWATYRFLETPIRHSRRPLWRPLAAGLATVCIAGLAIHAALLPARFATPEIASIERAMEDWVVNGGKPVHFEGQTFHQEGDAPSPVLFIGDSNMQQYYTRLHMVAARTGASAIYAASGGCRPIRGVTGPLGGCSPFISAAFDYAKSSEARTVVIAAQWSGFFTSNAYMIGSQALSSATGRAQALDALRADLETLRDSGKKVFLVLNIPIGAQFAPQTWIRRSLAGIDVVPERSVPHGAFPKVYREIADELRKTGEAAGAEVIDPTDFLCDRDGCRTLDERGEPIYKDSTHLRASFVRDHIEFLDRVFESHTAGTRQVSERQ